MRLGSYECILQKGTKAYDVYKTEKVGERHRHRYEFNPEFRANFEAAGFKVAGQSPDGLLVEMIEIAGHPWFLGCQFHPELKSRPTTPHPLFSGFVAAAIKQSKEG